MVSALVVYESSGPGSSPGRRRRVLGQKTLPLTVPPSPRCVRGTHKKVCIYTQLYVCCFEDKKRCVAVTHLI